MVFRAEQVRIGISREFTTTGYAVPMGTFTPVVGAQTQFPGPIISGFDSLEQLEVKPLKARAINASAAQREVFQLLELKRSVEDSFQMAVVDGMWAAKALGKDVQIAGTQGTSSPLTAPSVVGDTVIHVTSGTGFTVGAWVQVDTNASLISEVRKITNKATNDLTLDGGLNYPHASAAAAYPVAGTSNITHTITPLDVLPFPSTLMEINYLDATNLSIFLQGLTVDSLTISGGEADILNGTVNFKAFKAAKNTSTLSAITATTTTPYNFSQGAFTYFGSSVARVQDFSATINNGGKLKVYHNSTQGQFPFEYLTGAAEYTLDTTVLATDTTFFDALKTSGALAATILYTRAAGDTIQLSFTNCELKQAPHSIPEEAEVPIKLSLVPRNLTVTVVQPTLTAAYNGVWV